MVAIPFDPLVLLNVSVLENKSVPFYSIGIGYDKAI